MARGTFLAVELWLFALADTFPYHRCSDYNSSSLPYELSTPVEVDGAYCVTLTYKGPVSNPSTCYNVLATQGGSRIVLGIGESDRALSRIMLPELTPGCRVPPQPLLASTPSTPRLELPSMV